MYLLVANGSKNTHDDGALVENRHEPRAAHASEHAGVDEEWTDHGCLQRVRTHAFVEALFFAYPYVIVSGVVELVAQRLGHAHRGELAGAVVGEARHADEAAGRRDGDDVAPPLA